ncbi:GNAT family N-acetyltransferase [Inhella proteolytica]|uniref:GNAT family N-acetyltransferase n=1 Tax=Inhella proteolytica TaxID=2795029 RepID=A0A931J1X9_9BURK|nr:GNAT family N-acetyltransferase [Inhella proteolytica]MBH9576836.1 GNAT family N-acetyltransferase [Inhella proteolytica]
MKLVPLQDLNPDALVPLLRDTVALGASIGWTATPSEDAARAFWQRCQDSCRRGERQGFVAVAGDQVLGSAQLVLDTPANGAHRAEVCKVMVAPAARQRGLGAQLMQAAEAAAVQQGRRLLVLDTVRASPAERLYRRLGYQVCGHIPAYAMSTAGALEPTQVMFKRLGARGEWVQPVASDHPEALALQDALSALLMQRFGSDGRANFQGATLFVLARAADGTAQGCGALRPLAGEAGVAELKRMHALQARQGVGQRLLDYLEHEAWLAGWRQLRLSTRRANADALAFYAAAGYRECAPYGAYVGRAESICLDKRLA